MAKNPIKTLVSQAWEEPEVRDRVLFVITRHRQLYEKAKKALRVCRREAKPLRLGSYGQFRDENDVTVFLFIIAQNDGEFFLHWLRSFERAIDTFLHERKVRR